MSIRRAKSTPLSMTVGIAEAVMQARFDPVDIVCELINRAENALAAAKAEGANTVKALAPGAGRGRGHGVGTRLTASLDTLTAHRCNVLVLICSR